MQKLTKEMIEISKENKGICTLYDENYVILNKIMPVTDDGLNNYINSIKELKDKGVNIATILDYKLIKSNKKNSLYTKGFYLEERAKGTSFGPTENFWLHTNEGIDFDAVAIRYMKSIDTYISELEERAKADQCVYDKFVIDYLTFSEVGLLPDPNPSNFFFSLEYGYTIIDPVPAGRMDRFYNFLANYLFADVFGYGRSKIFIDDNLLNCMSQDEHNRLFKAANKLIQKITCALRNVNYPDELVKNAEKMVNNLLCLDNIKIVDRSNLAAYIEKEFTDLKQIQALVHRKQKIFKYKF